MADRMTEMLGVDFAELNVFRVFHDVAPVNCRGCGKLSGLDDIVNDALRLGIHDAPFMARAFKNREAGSVPPTTINCCVCGALFLKPDAEVSVRSGGLCYGISNGVPTGHYASCPELVRDCESTA